MRRWLLAVAPVATLLACARYDRADRRENDGPLLASVRNAGPIALSWRAQLSVPTAAPRVCHDRGTTVRCAARDTLRLTELSAIAGRARASLDAGVDADALHAEALIDLVAGDSAGKAADRSISVLEMVTRLRPNSASAFVDLAAAHLLLAERRDDARELLRALEAATQALAIDSTSTPARFDRAVALDALALDGEAEAEWARYLALESRPAWIAIARRDAARSVTLPPTTAHDMDSAPDSLAAFADQSPGRARTLAIARLLGDWGNAVAAGDGPRASRRLGAARAIGTRLAARWKDSSVVAMVRAIETADARARRSLALAHVRYDSAQRDTNGPNRARADSLLRRVLASSPTGPLAGWATFARTGALLYDGAGDTAEMVIDSLVPRLDERRTPALMARALWTRGVLTIRRGENERGLRDLRTAERLFGELGENEYRAAMVGMQGETLLEAGDVAGGYHGLHSAARALRATPRSQWRHGILLLLGRAAAADGLESAADALQSEDIALADATDDRIAAVEARLGRARALWATRREDAAQALAQAHRLVTGMPPGDAHARLSLELSLAEASDSLRSQPARARAKLDTVVVAFTALHNSIKLIPAYVARAEAALSLGDVAAAARDLDSAAALYDARSRAIATLPGRAALLAYARATYDALVMAYLAEGRQADALDALERARVSFAGRGASTARGHLRRGVVDYALIGDTLIAWTADAAGQPRVGRWTVGKSALVSTIARARAALEVSADGRTVREDLQRLYDWIVRPVAGAFGDSGSAAIVIADGVVADVPFAALYDASHRQYLVEQHPTTVVPALRDVALPHASAARPDDGLFVADPALDWRTFPGLAPLPAAAGEVRAAAAPYRRATMLSGTSADSAAVVQALRVARLFHFAGHAVVVDGHPERSFLAVGPHGLPAAAIAALDLRQLDLVVLSACESVRTPGGRTADVSGLTEAFLSAGAGGVVGSLWRVNDAWTAALMREFHRAYHASGRAAESLRSAQLTLLHSPDAALRSPAAWGAFRYVGR